MPKVGKKHYPYTAKGKAAAKAAAKRQAAAKAAAKRQGKSVKYNKGGKIKSSKGKK